jgi:hypothetical protein
MIGANEKLVVHWYINKVVQFEPGAVYEKFRCDSNKLSLMV